MQGKKANEDRDGRSFFCTEEVKLKCLAAGKKNFRHKSRERTQTTEGRGKRGGTNGGQHCHKDPFYGVSAYRKTEKSIFIVEL